MQTKDLITSHSTIIPLDCELSYSIYSTFLSVMSVIIKPIIPPGHSAACHCLKSHLYCCPHQSSSLAPMQPFTFDNSFNRVYLVFNSYEYSFSCWFDSHFEWLSSWSWWWRWKVTLARPIPNATTKRTIFLTDPFELLMRDVRVHTGNDNVTTTGPLLTTKTSTESPSYDLSSHEDN